MTYVFDLDGTLIDSRKRHWMLMVDTLRKHGIRVGADFAYSYMKFKADGHNGKRYLTDVLNIEESVANDIQNEWILHIEDEVWLQFDELYDDVVSTLRKISGDILFLTIRNNKDSLIQELMRLGLSGYKVIVLPHHEKKSEVLKQFTEDCIMVGDTEIDYYAAMEAGCNFYILSRGFRSNKYWEKQSVISHENLSQLLI